MNSLKNVPTQKIYLSDTFKRLKRSSVCSKFVLKDHEWDYLANRGLDAILLEGRTLLIKRFSQVDKSHSCKNEPLRHHPIFVALHGTGACCRRSLSKWHGIPKDIELKEKDIFFILLILKEWFIRQERPLHFLETEKEQLSLFCS
ncbi:hypothetical protein A9Q84_10345 [Halobacteriovorax marinus]|uniref:DUF4186 domain-containing protein n=1 Tax=Halobacteriovorax marinus TaxID=97084 RepID=A0A1Y5FB97_9BACT|nr:hypothetical protein A9Q84_10345 [Halobacteriovorax marinus]